MQNRLLPYLLLFLSLVVAGQVYGQKIQYGFQQDSENPYLMTAVAVPDFTSENVTISTALFTFALPELSVLSPAIEVVPKTGQFNDLTGSWAAQKITPQVYEQLGYDAKDLKGKQLYQVVLQNSPNLNEVRSGSPIPLFSFELLNDFQKGKLEVLANNGILHDVIYQNLRANFNNQISMSVDDAPSHDLYEKTDPLLGSVSFPINSTLAEPAVTEDIKPHLSVHPNPVLYQLQAKVLSTQSGLGDLLIYDVQQNEVLRQKANFEVGQNNFSFELNQLPAGLYLLSARVEDMILYKQFVKVQQ